MRTLLAALVAFGALSAAPSALADPCHARCRERARACKDRCKLRHEHFDEARHRCLQECELREHECRAGC
jgi:hypothetical protein